MESGKRKAESGIVEMVGIVEIVGRVGRAGEL